MSEPTLYLFDGFNLLHAGGYKDARELIDTPSVRGMIYKVQHLLRVEEIG